MSVKSYCCDQLYSRITVNKTLSALEEVRIKYGIQMLYLGLSKLVVLIFAALLIGDLLATLIAVASFNVIRSAAFGVHAKSTKQCFIFSFIGFVALPKIMLMLSIAPSVLVVISIAIPVLLYLYAPSDTEKRPLLGSKRRRQLKLTATKRGIMIVFLIFFIPSITFKISLLVGAMVQVILNLPVTYKLLNERRNNYEEFERSNE